MRLTSHDLRDLQVLKYYRLVRKWACKTYGLTDADLELLNYLGADPISATATRLSFKSMAGTAADDHVLLLHGSGKFKAVCEMMQAALNAGYKGTPLVITDVANGIVPFSGQFDLGITACQITLA